MSTFDEIKIKNDMNIKLINLLTVIAALTAFTACEKPKFIHDDGNLVPKTVEHDPSLPSISVNGTQLHAEAFGLNTNPLIVVLHGGPGADFKSLLRCKAFADQGYRVIFYDQRGSGLSKRHSKDFYSIQLMLDDLSAVIAHYRTSANQKVFLLGHSWGGMLATAYINKYPTIVNGTVLTEPGGFVWQDILDYVERSRPLKLSSELTSDLLYQDQFITGKDKEHAILDYKYGLLSMAEGNKDNPTGNEGKLPQWRSGAIVNKAFFDIGEKEKPDWRTNLSQYKTKVLFVYSENNKAYGLQHAQKVSSAYPNVQLLKVNSAGHDMLTFQTGFNNFYPVALSYFNSLK